MKWKFLYIKEDSLHFLTSDNPCFFFKHIGIANKDSELSFPISNKVALLATNKGADDRYKAPEKFIKEINRRTAFSSTRFVYSSKREDWINKVIKRKNTRLNQLII